MSKAKTVKVTRKPSKKPALPVSEPISATVAKEQDMTGGVIPAAFIRVYSSRGLEYWLMVVSLLIVLFSVTALLTDAIDFAFGNTEPTLTSGSWVFVEAAALVATGVYLYFSARLGAAEEISPRLLIDPSRKKAFQLGVKVSFMTLVFGSVWFIGTLIKLLFGLDFMELDASISQQLLTLFISVGLAKATFFYFLDEEKKGGRV